MNPSNVININLGILGHVDSGKTSLCRLLSTHLSTSSLDKNPQSQQRGITLELGFSAFYISLERIPYKSRLYQQVLQHNQNDHTVENTTHDSSIPFSSAPPTLQFTLVDSPGHASLIRTILSGASIIDYMILVIDATKGIQTQTAECLVISEILKETCHSLLVVINKCDLLHDYETQYSKLVKQIQHALKQTRWRNREIPIIGMSATTTTNATAATTATSNNAATSNQQGNDENHNITKFVDTLLNHIELPIRNSTHTPIHSTPHSSSVQPQKSSSFLFQVDHCFSMKGAGGTVLTGTVLRGDLHVNDTIEIPSLHHSQHKIKSIQRFKQPLQHISHGDRAGLCITPSIDSSLLEHGIICTPHTVLSYHSVIVSIEKIKFYKFSVKNKQRYHISIGNETVMATIYLFVAASSASHSQHDANDDANKNDEYKKAETNGVNETNAAFNFQEEYLSLDELPLPPTTSTIDDDVSNTHPHPSIYALLVFDRITQIPSYSLLIGSKLDTDIHSKSCRLAFTGRMLAGYDIVENSIKQSISASSASTTPPPELHLTKYKVKVGVIDRIEDPYTMIVRDFFPKQSSGSSGGEVIQTFLQFPVTYTVNVSDSVNNHTPQKKNHAPVVYHGTIESTFGQTSHKVRCRFNTALPVDELKDSKARKPGKPQYTLRYKEQKEVLLKYKTIKILGRKNSQNHDKRKRLLPMP